MVVDDRLAAPPVKLTTVAIRAFPVVGPWNERSARRRDLRRIVIHLPSAT